VLKFSRADHFTLLLQQWQNQMEIADEVVFTHDNKRELDLEDTPPIAACRLHLLDVRAATLPRDACLPTPWIYDEQIAIALGHGPGQGMPM
jgi:hypothetical protein